MVFSHKASQGLHMVLFCVFLYFVELVRCETAVVWQKLGENSTQILFKAYIGFEGHEGEQIMTELSFLCGGERSL